jgi:hypothetical protein
LIHLVFFSLPVNFSSFLAISPFGEGKVYIPDFYQPKKYPLYRLKGINPKRGSKSKIHENFTLKGAISKIC